MPKVAKKVIIVLFLALFLVNPLDARAVGISDLLAQIQVLQNQLNQLKNQTSGKPLACQGITFTRPLQIGSVGEDVKCLQAVLNMSDATRISLTGIASPGQETMRFGSLTARSVVKFQELYADEILDPSHFKRGTGIVGPATIKKLNALLLAADALTNSNPKVDTSSTAFSPSIQNSSPTTAINKSLPAVISVLATKDALEYQVVYEVAVGDDPFFKDFTRKVPVRKPTGKIISSQVGAGTGFLIDPRGYILTTNHVVSDTQANCMVVFADGNQVPAQVAYQDLINDIAIIKIDGSGYPILPLGDSDLLELGQTVVAIGNALGQLSNSVSVGNVSGLNRNIQASDKNGVMQTLNNTIQTTAPINLGNSGGPLLDADGNAVGINVAMAKGANNISFAIPINAAKSIIESVVK